MSAPRRVELNEHVLGVIEDNILERLTNNGVYSLVLLRWNRLALELGLEFASDVFLDQDINLLGSDFLGLAERVLELLAEVLEDEARPFGLSEVERLGVVAELDTIDPNKVDFALVFLCNGPDTSDVFVFLFFRRVDEEVTKRESAGYVSLEVVTADFVDIRDRVLLSEALNFLDGSRGSVECKVNARLVEFPVEDNCRRLDTCFLDGPLVGGETEEEVVAVFFGGFGEFWSGCLGFAGEVGDEDESVGFLEFGVVVGFHFGDSGEGLSAGFRD